MLSKKLFEHQYRELKRQRLRTLARELSQKNSLDVDWSNIPKAELTSGKIMLPDCEANGILSNIPATETEAWAAMKALAAHEAAHIRFSSAQIGKNAAKDNLYLKELLNALEDGRIERLIRQKYPGVGRWLDFYNHYVLSRQDANSQHPFTRFCYAASGYATAGVLVNVPEKCLVEKYRAEIDAAVNAPTTREARDIARELLQKPDIKKLLPPEPAKLNAEPGQKNAPAAESAGGQAEKDDQEEAAYPGADARDDVEKDEEAKEETDEKAEDEEKPEENGGETDEADAEEADTAEETGEKTAAPIEPQEEVFPKRKDFSAVLKEAQDELSTLRLQALKTKSKPTMQEIAESCAVGIHAGVKLEYRKFAKHRADSTNLYPGTVSQLKRELENILKARCTRYFPTKKGSLNPAALYKISTQDTEIFRKKAVPGKVDVAFHILIDQSGSMWGDKIQLASRAAYICLQALLALRIPAAATSFSTRKEKVVHQEVKAWDKNETFTQRLESNAENRDGFSIRVAGYDLLQRPEQKKILLVLSDGLPSHYGFSSSKARKYSGNLAMKDSARAVRELEKLGISVIGLYFGSSYHLEKVRLIYPRLIYIEQVESLPALLSRTVKKILQE